MKDVADDLTFLEVRGMAAIYSRLARCAIAGIAGGNRGCCYKPRKTYVKNK